MVNNVNHYKQILPDIPDPPDENNADSSDRHIGDQPLWCIKTIIDLIKSDNYLVVTNKGENNHEVLVANGFDLKAEINYLTTQDYLGSYWCKASGKRGKGKWLPCDSYRLKSTFTHPVTGYTGPAVYYLKMCKNIYGDSVLIISIHLSS